MSLRIKMVKRKVIDRVCKELQEAIENLNAISDKETELIPDKFVKRLHMSAEFLNTISDMIKDMDYEGE